MLMPVRGSTFQFLKYDVQIPALHDFTFCIWVKSSNFSHPHPLFSYSSELRVLTVFSSSGIMRSVTPRIHLSVLINASNNSTNFRLNYVTFETERFKLQLATRSSFGCGLLKHNGKFELGSTNDFSSTTTFTGQTFGITCGNKMPTRCNRRFLLQILLLAQHVLGTIMSIIRNSRVL